MEYRRAWRPGGWYFFTVVTYKRQPILTVSENVSRLRMAFGHVKRKHPFEIDGIVVLPDHLHCIWRLPEEEDDFATRWRLIKHFFSRSCLSLKEAKSNNFDGPASLDPSYVTEVSRMGGAERTKQSDSSRTKFVGWVKQSAPINPTSRTRKREKAVWQRRYWEHLIRNKEDWRRHMDYIHYNPVKHGLAARPCDWPHSSFEKVVKQGLYERDWGSSEPETIGEMDFE